MFRSAKQMGVAAVLGIAVCASPGPEVRGQYRPPWQAGQGTTPALPANSGVNANAGAGNVGGVGLSSTAGLNSLASPYGTNPALGQYSSPYGYSSAPLYGDPFGGYITGAASVINAQANFTMSLEKAKLLKEQVRGERLANRRKAFELYLFERDNAPTAEEERQKTQLDQVGRSRANAPVADIWSGKALNDLLTDLRRAAVAGDLISGRPLPLPLDEAGLKHINVTKDTHSVAFLKNKGRLDWPLALMSSELEGPREQVGGRVREAVRAAEVNGRVDPAVVRQLLDDMDGLHTQLRLRVKVLSPSEYIEAKTFLQHLGEALRALRQPDVGNHFTGKYVLRGRTVPELVRQMEEQGLHIAPALPGDEAAYIALHQALAAYNRTAPPQVTAQR
jgi:hypothetical protein